MLTSLKQTECEHDCRIRNQNSFTLSPSDRTSVFLSPWWLCLAPLGGRSTSPSKAFCKKKRAGQQVLKGWSSRPMASQSRHKVVYLWHQMCPRASWCLSSNKHETRVDTQLRWVGRAFQKTLSARASRNIHWVKCARSCIPNDSLKLRQQNCKYEDMSNQSLKPLQADLSTSSL